MEDIPNPKFSSDSKALIDSVLKEFPAGNSIEIYVLSPSGRSQEVFSGPSRNLSSNDFRYVLTSPGTMYAFSIAGTPVKEADLADLFPTKVVRKSFGWITAPSAPMLEERGSNSLALKWDPLVSCGVEFDVEGNVTYSLEGAEVDEYHRGVPARSIDINSLEYKVVHRSTSATRAIIEDLKSSHWYYWRVVIEYCGACFVSEPVAINTAGGIPLTPECPTVSVHKCPGPILDKREGVELAVILEWPEAKYVGPSIDKYLLQLYEVFVDLREDQREIFYPGFGSVKSKLMKQAAQAQDPAYKNVLGKNKIVPESNTKAELLEKIRGEINQSMVQSTRWITISCDGANKITLKSPKVGTLQWNLRLKAKNCNGYSKDWLYFYMNFQTNPEIFPAGKVVNKSWYANFAAAPRDAPERLFTQPGRSHLSPNLGISSSSVVDSDDNPSLFLDGKPVDIITKTKPLACHESRMKNRGSPRDTMKSSQKSAKPSKEREEDSVWIEDSQEPSIYIPLEKKK